MNDPGITALAGDGGMPAPPRTTARIAADKAMAEAGREAAGLEAELGCTASAWKPKPGSVEASWPDGLLLIGTPQEIRDEYRRQRAA